jgi:hypothetical protein
LGLKAFGTCIPRFKSFYKEGGNVYLQYEIADVRIDYRHYFNNFGFSLGYRYSYLHHIEESEEDTNRFKISASGFAFGAAYKFPSSNTDKN